MGAIPTGIKVALRGLGNKVCMGYKSTIEMFYQLSVDCPSLSNNNIRFCGWIGKVWGIKISKV